MGTAVACWPLTVHPFGDVQTADAVVGDVPTEEAVVGDIPTEDAVVGDVPTVDAEVGDVVGCCLAGAGVVGAGALEEEADIKAAGAGDGPSGPLCTLFTFRGTFISARRPVGDKKLKKKKKKKRRRKTNLCTPSEFRQRFRLDSA